MLISFYHTSLCPRCARARKHLKELLGDRYEHSVTEIDTLTHPITAWQNDIRMIPALKCNGYILSSIMLSRSSISAFLSKHGDKKPS